MTAQQLPQSSSLLMPSLPIPATTIDYPPRSLSPAPQQPQVTHSQTQQPPRSLLKKAVRFNEDVRQRMFSNVRGGDEDAEEEKENGGRGDEEDEFDMFQTRTASTGRSAAPMSVAGDSKPVEIKESFAEEKAAVEEARDVDRQQQRGLQSEWSTLSTPTVRSTKAADADTADEPTLAATSTSYSYDTADDTHSQQQQEQQRSVQDELTNKIHASLSDSSSDEESEAEEEQEEEAAVIDDTDDEPLDLTDLATAAEPIVPHDDTQADDQQHAAHQPTTHITAPQPTITAQVAPAASTHTAPYQLARPTTTATATATDTDSDSDTETDTPAATRIPQPQHRAAQLSHLPPLSSLRPVGGGVSGIPRYKSSLAIRGGRGLGGSGGGGAVVGDSEAVLDILAGGRKKVVEEHKEASETESGDVGAVVVAAARVLDVDGDASDVDDGMIGISHGKRQLQASVDRVFGSSAVVSRVAATPDSDDDDDDMVVVKG